MSIKKTFQHGVRFDQEIEHKLQALCRAEQRNFNNLIEVLIVKEFERKLEAGEIKVTTFEQLEAQQG